MAPAVQLRSAVALAGRFPALSGVDLTVDPGEVVVVLGPNGSGKTSLLRTCAGLLAVTSGQAEVLGHDLRVDRTEVRRRVGLLGHAAPLYDELTAAENVRFAVRAARLPVDAGRPALERWASTDGCRRTAVRLSAGQRRRGRPRRRWWPAGPELWLLDEPHAGLDAAAHDAGRRPGPTRPPAGATVVARLARARPGHRPGRPRRHHRRRCRARRASARRPARSAATGTAHAGPGGTHVA